MILSMTGYGEVQHSHLGVSYALELRSVNNRYFKAQIKLPEHLSIFEDQVEKLLRTRLVRGSITYTLKMRNCPAEAVQEINVVALQGYLAQLSKVAAASHVHVDLAGLLAMPGVCQPPDLTEAERQSLWQIIEPMTTGAVDQVIAMRRAEGQALRADLLTQCRQIRQQLTAIAQRAPEARQAYYQRLLQRANELLAQTGLELQAQDMAREVALYSERCDINEELSRLSSHLDQFEQLCDGPESPGRKLDFLSQELLREANTIASKANDSAITQLVVEIKTAVDRLKEQLQNVE